MKISVLIPTYRNADTVVATVESVLAQRRTPHEIIVLLDGVADDTPHLLAPYADRIRIVQQENAGVAQARNRLVAEARGEMLAFLDADDLWHPDTLLAQEMALRMAPTAGAAYCGHVEFTSTPPPWPATLDAQPVELLGPREFFAG
jgi:glycosyltransferase involved in cell wall biosynthesis